MVRKAFDESLQNEKEAIRYFQLNDELLVPCQLICDQLFGEGYIKIQLPDEYHVGWVAQLNYEVIGFGTGLIEKTGMYNQIKLANKPVGIVHMIGVLPEFQRHGVGAELIKAVVKDLGKIEIVGFAWEQDGKLVADKILKSVGLKQKKPLGLIWKQACDGGEFNCPDRINECICKCVLFSNE